MISRNNDKEVALALAAQEYSITHNCLWLTVALVIAKCETSREGESGP